MTTLKITNEIHQNWIDAELAMANFDGDDHPAFICHNEIGKTIYGDNLEKVRQKICDCRIFKISDLKEFEQA